MEGLAPRNNLWPGPRGADGVLATPPSGVGAEGPFQAWVGRFHGGLPEKGGGISFLQLGLRKDTIMVRLTKCRDYQIIIKTDLLWIFPDRGN